MVPLIFFDAVVVELCTVDQLMAILIIISLTYIFTCKPYHPPGHVERVFPGTEHSGEPVE